MERSPWLAMKNGLPSGVPDDAVAELAGESGVSLLVGHDLRASGEGIAIGLLPAGV